MPRIRHEFSHNFDTKYQQQPKIADFDKDGDIVSEDGTHEWVAFGDNGRVIYLIHNEDDNAVDSYWPMNGEMTVFGFGRRNLEKHMTELPAKFTIGLYGSSNYLDISDAVNNAFKPLKVNVTAEH